VPKLANFAFPIRASVVAGFSLLGYFSGSFGYWKFLGEHQRKICLNGAPLYSKKFDVPDLNNLYFYLDDDQNYKPTLFHHAVYFWFL